jgi:DNA modification methylase
MTFTNQEKIPSNLNKNVKIPTILPKPNTPIYNMIRIWGRKTPNVVAKYIEWFTKEGEVVLDPFAGSGPAIIEALRLKRRAIYNDLNNFLTFIVKASLVPVTLEEIEKSFKLIKQTIMSKSYEARNSSGERITLKFKDLYTTYCSEHDSEAVIISTKYAACYSISPNAVDIVKREASKGKIGEAGRKLLNALEGSNTFTIDKLRETVKPEELGFSRSEELTRTLNFLVEKGCLEAVGEVPLEIKYFCKLYGETQRSGRNFEIKQPERDDIERIRKISELEPPFYYPRNELLYPNGQLFLTYRPGVETIDKLFTRRNIIALSILRKEIEDLEVSENIKNVLRLAFASIIYQCSKMCREGAGSWGEKNYVIRPVFLEKNVLHVFTNKKKIIMKGKEEALSFKDFVKEATNPKEVIMGDATVCFMNDDARKLMSSYEDCIDYIFTDPEYGDSVQYYELSLMASSWLGIENDWKDEIVVNPKQGKTREVYREMLREAFLNCYRLLKPGRYMTVTFHSREIKYWNDLLYAITSSGFEYVDAVYQPPPKEYKDWLYARNPGKMSGDIYITFKKPIHPLVKEEEPTELQRIIHNVIIPEAIRTIKLHGGKASYDILVRNITLELLRRGLLHRKEIQELDYEKIFDSYFERLK